MDRPAIRPILPSDSLAELTALLHRAYAELLAAGLNFTAATQDEAKTRERIEGNECFVAVAGGRLVGTATLLPLWPDDVPAPPGPGRAAYLFQLAVDPALRRRGLGSLLMDRCEDRARESGFARLGLDTAEPAAHLLALYGARGYRSTGFARWPGKTYRSVILVKDLGPVRRTRRGRGEGVPRRKS